MSNVHRRNRRRGKDTERLVARILGCKRRNADRGTACSDTDSDRWSVEITRTVASGGQWEKKWKQAVRNAELEGMPPMLVFLRPRQRWQKALVTLELGEFATLLNKEETCQTES